MVALSNAQIGEIIHELLNASGLEQVRRLLQAHRRLIFSAEVDDRLTRMIGDVYQVRDLESLAMFSACRGFLRRCRSAGVEAALKTQPAWPLSSQGPLRQLLALKRETPAELFIQRAEIALSDIEQETEADVYGFICYYLGLGYQIQADQGSNQALDLSIKHLELAVQAWEQQDAWFGTSLSVGAKHKLGRLYWKRRHGNRSQDIETALGWLEQVVAATEDQSIERRDALVLVGDAYLHRIKAERLENIEQAISHYKQAYRLTERLERKTVHPEERGEHEEYLGGIGHNLAVAYRMRLGGDRSQNYERAKKLAERALRRFNRKRHPEEWARTAAELATIHNCRLEGNRDANLETAIKYAQQALEIYHPDTHPVQYTLVQLTLGNLYCDRLSGVRSENEDSAIACFQKILDRCDQQSDPLRWSEAMNNLGTVYAGRSSRLKDANYRQAIKHYREALKVRRPDTLPTQALQTAGNWGNLNFWFGNWAGASKAFKKALQAGKALYQASSTEAGRRAELAETWQLVARAAYCWLRRKRPNQALLELEGGKARLLAEALALGDSDLDMLPDTQQEAVLGARQTIRKLEAEMRLPRDAPGRRDDRVLAQKLQRARTELDQLIQTIRAEYPDFMPTGLNLRGILDQIPEGGALVAPLVTVRGSAAFVLPSGTKKIRKKHIVYLDAFTAADLNLLLIGNQWSPGWLSAYAAWREAENGSLQAWKRAIETFTGQLWEALMGPIYQRLSELGLTEGAPVILMPQGGLGLLPLHAAWRWVNGVQRAFLDDYTVSYAPSAYALSISRRRLQDDRRHQPALLAAINPTGDLLYAPMEGEAVAETFPSAVRRKLVEGEATSEAVLDIAPGHTYLHFACHGLYDWQDVMRSALVLAGRHHFTLSEIISKLDLTKARLVTLSACETGLSEFQQSPDEYIGLPAGFLQAGVPAVVSTLWAVDDLSTALLMAYFYCKHLKEGLQPSQALRAAQHWLRKKVDRPYVIEHIQSLLADLKTKRAHVSPWSEEAWAIDRQIAQFEEQCRYFRKKEKRDPGGRPFAHPYYWAGFTVSGADSETVEGTNDA